MLTISDIRNALIGSFLLAKNDTSGLKFFDLEIDGFWRSFLIIVPIAPLYMLYALQDVQVAHEINPQNAYLVANTGFIVAKIILLMIGWLIFPIAMIFITRLLNLWPKYIPFIATYNWVSLFIMLLFAPSALLYFAGLFSAQMASMLNFLVTLFAIYFSWFIAKTVLETTAITAALIVVFDFTLSLLAHGLFNRLTGY